MKKLILLDAGHGGIIEGTYVTPGKRYYGIHEGYHIRLAEGAINRLIVHGIASMLHLYNIPVHIINPENEDISLRSRVYRVNQLAKEYDCFLLSIHHNAFQDKNVKGAEIFTSMGDTRADPLAEKIGKEFSKRFPEVNLRRDRVADYSKDAPYYILRKTSCPAVLSEWAFMTNVEDRNIILDRYDDQISFYANVIKDHIHRMI